MTHTHLLVAGGAGFVGSSLAILFRERFPLLKITAIDSLKRRGSELNLPRLAQSGIDFLHADIRAPDDLAHLPDFDLFLDCAAEPSVHSGVAGSPRGVLETNLRGTINCLEAARERRAAFLFLSTSRVYSIPDLNRLPFTQDETRFRWTPGHTAPGFHTDHGIAEDFSLQPPRSFYGATKLASELLIQEYVHLAGIKALINRCGVIAGPWQMGKVDQGVITLWVARHFFKQPLDYTGFGGSGKQVRDVLHVADLFELLCRQLDSPHAWDGRTYNVGGGPALTTSLRELTATCQEVTGNTVPIGSSPETSPVDVRIYSTDSRKAQSDFSWTPSRSLRDIVEDIHRWIAANADSLQARFCPHPAVHRP
jgi:CDP-paratose 2-epimerase